MKKARAKVHRRTKSASQSTWNVLKGRSRANSDANITDEMERIKANGKKQHIEVDNKRFIGVVTTKGSENVPLPDGEDFYDIDLKFTEIMTHENKKRYTKWLLGCLDVTILTIQDNGAGLFEYTLECIAHDKLSNTGEFRDFYFCVRSRVKYWLFQGEQ